MFKKVLFVSTFGTLFFTGCFQNQPQIKKFCVNGIYIPKYDVCQLTNKPIKGTIINIEKCNKNQCIYIIDDEVNNKIKIKESKRKYKIGDVIDIILYTKPKIVKVNNKDKK